MHCSAKFMPKSSLVNCCFRASVLLLAFLTWGCRAKEGDDDGDAPALPSHLVLTYDTNSILSEPAEMASSPSAAYELLLEEFAGTLVQLSAELKLPSDLIRVAKTSVIPVYTRNSSWVWSYEFSKSEFDYNVGLTGTKRGDNRTWLFEVTKRPKDSFGCCESFDYITGSSAGGSSGVWRVYDMLQPQGTVLLRTITWVYASESSYSATVTFASSPTYAPDFAEGSTLTYVLDGEQVTVTLDYDGSGVNPIVGRWSIVTGAGSRSEAETTECWDETFADVECAAPGLRTR